MSAQRREDLHAQVVEMGEQTTSATAAAPAAATNADSMVSCGVAKTAKADALLPALARSPFSTTPATCASRRQSSSR